ncbi:SDR family NAD(P)-dependent oxidoreductase [Methylobacterium sp. WL120]|uniref:SDR family NAD(P)-dependent oxidoreductase n=1 Tax=Methylobacterium sp. WL120 TaxID=2603887 RepID=UPI0011CC847C|nr:SDR family NAD(P)-dependent oxidoreductase [Methylobacterium sp. WL120]TXM67628.1 SDR family oxidoreductase [Methylobacterium sp. WL120]
MDRIVVVTGAAGGIGRALCARFAADGATVVAADIDAAGAAETAAEVGGTPATCDVGEAESVADLVARTIRDHGRVDVYASNAGILLRDPDPENAASAAEADWASAWAVNVMGHVHAARALLPDWIARRSGSFLATVSAAGLLSQIGSATYSTTKHAALGFCEHLAITHRDHGIRVAALCPQGVDTAMVRGASPREPALRDGLLSPAAVAEAAFTGLAEGRFLILPHGQVAAYVRRKADDHDRWIGGMAKLRRARG